MSSEFPAANDKLFRHDLSDWTNNAILNYLAGKFPPYAAGYREGFNALITECVAERGLNDILIYPRVFLARQYVELRLKEIIIGLDFCANGTNEFPKTHKIDKIWFQFKNLYQEIGESTSELEFHNAEKIILEFATMDPLSMAFRYPVDKEGNNTLSISHINIRNFGEVMNRLANFLDAISDQIAHYADITSDMYRDLYVSYE